MAGFFPWRRYATWWVTGWQSTLPVAQPPLLAISSQLAPHLSLASLKCGWASLDADADKKDWIASHSDHSLLFFEVEE